MKLGELIATLKAYHAECGDDAKVFVFTDNGPKEIEYLTFRALRDAVDVFPEEEGISNANR